MKFEFIEIWYRVVGQFARKRPRLFSYNTNSPSGKWGGGAVLRAGVCGSAAKRSTGNRSSHKPHWKEFSNRIAQFETWILRERE
jgi:hypothetical protein